MPNTAAGATRDSAERASITDFQDVLRHESDKMARHHAGKTREFAVRALLTKYSLAG